MAYSVITFCYEDLEYVSACPKKWINFDDNTCRWPNNKSIERKAINMCIEPQDNWKKLQILHIIGHYANVKEALAVEKAKQESSSETEIPNKPNNFKRKIKKNKKYSDSSISPPPLLDHSEVRQTGYNGIENDNCNEETDDNSDSNLLSAVSGLMTAANSETNKTAETADEETESNTDVQQINHELGTPNTICSDSETSSILEKDYSKKPSNFELCTSNTIRSDSEASFTLEKDYNFIISTLIDLKTLVMYTSRKVDAIERRLNIGEVEKDSMEGKIMNHLPLKEVQDLQIFEEELKKKQLLEKVFDAVSVTLGRSNRKGMH